MGVSIQKSLDFLREHIPSAWIGHENFAVWLVKKMKPSVIVDLGVDYGFSTFAFATPQIGKVYGIDWFEGDKLAGWRNTENHILELLKILKERFGINNVEIIKGDFSEIAKEWKLPIDILHIDGSHKYEDVKKDYETWSKFVKKDGVILFHDVHITAEFINPKSIKEFGVERFFDEIDLPKFKFLHSFGLGVVSKNKKIINNIKKWNKQNY